MVTAKVSITDTYGLAPLQVRERAVMNTVLIWPPHRKCTVKILIGHKSGLTVVRARPRNYKVHTTIKICMATTVSYLRVGTVLQFYPELHNHFHWKCTVQRAPEL